MPHIGRFLLSLLTAPIAAVYGAVTAVRNSLFDHGILPSEAFPLPVICVGNLAVGGTGKTPHVEYLLHLLHQEGLRVAMLSRGYGRRTKGYAEASAATTAAEIGDEPYQMAHNCPFATVAVCEDRREGLRRLLQLKPSIDVVVLDDAYQHRYVRAGLYVLLTEAARPYTHDHLLPRGRLREHPRGAQRAQIVVMTKCDGRPRPDLATAPHQHLFYSHIVYGPLRLLAATDDAPTATTPPAKTVSTSEAVKGRSVLLITGIAHPDSLISHIEDAGAAAVESLAFPDHHRFTQADVARINQAAVHCDLAITTQKDATRLAPLAPLLSPTLRSHLYVQPITVSLETADGDHTIFNNLILSYVKEHPRDC